MKKAPDELLSKEPLSCPQNGPELPEGNQLQEKRQKFILLSQSRAFVDAESRVRFLLQRLDELYARLCGTVPRLFQLTSAELAQLRKELCRHIDYYLKSRRRQLETDIQHLSAL